MKEASSIPVTVKFRKGWDDSHINAVEFAQMAEAAGADAVTVHGRTRQQMYAPPVDWEIIRQVKNAVSIPVIGNGDVVSPETAKALYETTGCDLNTRASGWPAMRPASTVDGTSVGCGGRPSCAAVPGNYRRWTT